MKNKEKIFTAVAGISAIVAVYKLFKKNLKELKKSDEEESDKDKLEGSDTLSLKELESNFISSNDIMLDLSKLIRYSTDWSLDSVSIELGLGRNFKDTRKTIHVIQRGGDLKFLLEIPIKQCGYKLPDVGDFVVSLGNETKYIGETYAKLSPKPFGTLIGYTVISYQYKDDEEKTTHYMMNPFSPSMVKKNCTGDNDKIGKVMTNTVKEKLEEIEDGKVDIENGDPDSDKTNAKLVGAKLFWDMSFPIRDNDNLVGISAIEAKNILEYMLDNMKISSKQSDSTYSYKQVLLYREMNPDVCIIEPGIDEDGKLYLKDVVIFDDKK